MSVLQELEGGVRAMELVSVPAGTSVDPSRGTVTVAHDACGTRSYLAGGDEVVLRDADGELHAGVVTSLGMDDGELHYTIRRGVRLPPEAAHQRLSAPAPGEEHATFSEAELLDLLGELRDRDV